MFIAALFTIGKIWKQPKFPMIDKWMRKLWNISLQWNLIQPQKKKKILPFAATWVNFESVMLNEIMSETERQILYDLLYVESTNKTKN